MKKKFMPKLFPEMLKIYYEAIKREKELPLAFEGKEELFNDFMDLIEFPARFYERAEESGVLKMESIEEDYEDSDEKNCSLAGIFLEELETYAAKGNNYLSNIQDTVGELSENADDVADYASLILDYGEFLHEITEEEFALGEEDSESPFFNFLFSKKASEILLNSLRGQVVINNKSFFDSVFDGNRYIKFHDSIFKELTDVHILLTSAYLEEEEFCHFDMIVFFRIKNSPVDVYSSLFFQSVDTQDKDYPGIVSGPGCLFARSDWMDYVFSDEYKGTQGLQQDFYVIKNLPLLAAHYLKCYQEEYMPTCNEYTETNKENMLEKYSTELFYLINGKGIEGRIRKLESNLDS